jgi:hypothetical protein
MYAQKFSALVSSCCFTASLKQGCLFLDLIRIADHHDSISVEREGDVFRFFFWYNVTVDELVGNESLIFAFYNNASAVITI